MQSVRQSLSRIALTAALAFGLFLSHEKAHGYAFNPWTTMTGEKVLAVNPFLYATPLSPFGFGADLVAMYGFTPKFDIFVNFTSFGVGNNAVGYSAYNGWAGFWVMPRFDLGSGFVVALNLGYINPGVFNAQPELHGFWETDVFAFEATVKLSMQVSSAFVFNPKAFLAPVLKIAKGIFHLYVEVDPAYSTGTSAFTLDLIPGIWLGLAEAKHQFTLCFTGINYTTAGAGFTVTPGIGLWYFTTFDLSGGKKS